MPRSLGGGDPTLVSELTGDVLSCEVPERFRGADRASALYHAFTVSAENSKGESDQSEPGPQPRLFDRARIEAERDAMEALHDSLASNGPVPIGGLVGAVGEDTAVRSAAAAAPSAPEVAASVMGRLRAAAAMTDEAEAVLAHQGDGMGAVAEEASMALSSADLTAAMEQAEAVARLLHVWDVATEADGGGCITCAEYAASAAADPAIGRALAALPTLRVAIDQLTQSHAGDLSRSQLEAALRDALPPLAVEREARMRREAAEGLLRKEEDAKRQAEEEARKREEEAAAQRAQEAEAEAAERARRKAAKEAAAEAAAAEAAAREARRREAEGRAARGMVRAAEEQRAASSRAAASRAVREAARLKDKATAEAESEAAMSAAVSRWGEEDAALDAEHRARAEEVEARVSAAKAETEARIGEADAQALR